VNAERDSHPDAHVRRKMLVLWLLHCGVTRELAATIAGLGRATPSSVKSRRTATAVWMDCGNGM